MLTAKQFRVSFAVQALALVSLVTFTTSPVFGQTPSVCRKEEFNCLDGVCLPDNKTCNGIRDCTSGLDELVCTTSKCPPGFFTCGRLGQCVEQRRVCDGVRDCDEGQDEQQCPAASPGDPCLSTQFHCSSSGVLGERENGSVCIPLRDRCNRDLDCLAGEDEEDCGIPRLIQGPVPEVRIPKDGTITLNCVARGTPTPVILWMKNSMPLPIDPRISTASTNGDGVLVIRNATVADEGVYSCVVQVPFFSFVVPNTTNTLVLTDGSFTCRDHNNRRFPEGDRYYLVESFTSGDARTAAVDVVFVVDESGSIRTQDWIRNITSLLEQGLRAQGVGLGDQQNQFALVGFGRNMPSGQGGVVLTELTTPENFINASRSLRLDGLIEDGYSGIEVALNQIPLRPNTARLLVLVTNEDRSILPGREALTRDVMEQLIRSRGFVLNAVVDQTFQTSPGLPAFGLNSNRTAYVFNQSSAEQFFTAPNGSRHSDPTLTFMDTYEDYVQLAFNLGGAAWDIKALLVDNSPFLPAFSRAFVEENVMEVMGVFRRCFNCLCIDPMRQCIPASSVPVDQCQGNVPSSMDLSAAVNPMTAIANIGSNFTFECTVSADPPLSPSSLNITWIKHALPGSPVVICSGATCSGNTLTITNVQEDDQALYFCRVNAPGRMPAMSIVGSMLEIVDPPRIVVSPENSAVVSGKPLVVMCSATGIPTPSIRWIRTDGGLVSNNAQVQTEGNTSTLIIDPAQLTDRGTYTCIAINTFGRDDAPFTVEVTVTACEVDGETLEIGEFQIIFRLDNSSLSADIVLLVDESSSMSMEHMWIRNMTKELDRALESLRIGTSLMNRFGVAGFASSSTAAINQGRVLRPRLVNVSEIDSLVDQLMVDGRMEDGYAVIQFASNNYVMDRRARQFILITDENRDVLNHNLTRSSILELLRRTRTRLNVAVSEQFEASDLRALGLDDAMNAYIFDPLSPSLLRRRPNGQPFVDSAFQTTHEDYTVLALMADSGAWDLSLLRQGGNVAEAFTRAFVMTEVEEIVKQLRDCQNCTCFETGLVCVEVSSPDDHEVCSIQNILSSLRPSMDPTVRDLRVTITPRYTSSSTGSSVTLRCETSAGTVAWTFEGGNIPDNVNVTTMGSTSVLHISNVMLRNRGRYVCLARQVDQVNEMEMIREGEATSYIEVTPRNLNFGLEINPDVIMISSGETVNITCNVMEDAELTWLFRDNRTLPSNAVLTVSQRALTLTIIDATTENSGVYTCWGTQSETGVGADGFVIVTVKAHDPTLTVSPVALTVEEGTSVRFVCSTDMPGAILRWFSRERPLPSSAMLLPSTTPSGGPALTLVISSPTTDDCGQFVCESTHAQQSRMATVNLLVTAATRVELGVGNELLSNDTILLMFNVSEYFLCSSNQPVALWTWLFNGDTSLPDGVVPLMLPDNRALLIIQKTTENHVGTFVCVATIGNSTFSDSVAVSVGSPSQVISSPLPTPLTTPSFSMSPSPQPPSPPSFVRPPATQPPSPSGTPQPPSPPSEPLGPSGTPQPPSGPSSFRIPSHQSSSLSPFPSPSPSFSQSLLLPSITPTPTPLLPPVVSPGILELDAGVNANITCTANTAATIIWTYMNSSLPTNVQPVVVEDSRVSILMIVNFNADIGGMYTCTVSNGMELMATSAIVSLRGPAIISVSPGTLSRPEGTSAIFDCTASRPVTSFTWIYADSESGDLPAQTTVNMVSSTVSQLTVRFVGGSNTGTYRCTGSFPPRGVTATDVGILSIQDPNTLRVRIRGEQDIVTIAVGGSASVVCELDCTCSGARVRWSREDGVAFPNSVREQLAITQRRSTLIITGATNSVAGVYTCTGTFESDTSRAMTRIIIT